MTECNCIDEAAIATLKELGGTEFVLQIIETFLAYAAKVILEARSGLLSGNLEPVIRMGHSLHSGARSLGATKVMDISGRIERAARAQQIVLLDPLFAEMDQAFSEVKVYFKEIQIKLMQ